MVKLTCKYCGKTFNRPPSWLKAEPSRGQYCSKSCKMKDWHAHPPEGFRDKISQTLKRKYESGEITHLSKLDPMKWKRAMKKSSKTQTGKPKPALRGRKRPPFSKEWRRKLSESRKGVVVNRERHDKRIIEEMERLRGLGYRVIPIGLWKFPIPDLVNIKDGVVMAVEIELSGHNKSRLGTKFKSYREYFDEVDVIES